MLKRFGNLSLVWLGALALEALVVALVHRPEFAGLWELVALMTYAVPMALVCTLPIALVIAAAEGEGKSHALFRAIAIGAALAVLAFALTGGRRALPFRWPAVAFASVAGSVLAWSHFEKLRRVPPAAWLALAIGAWCADAWILPRLYPAFHLALALLFLSALAPIASRMPWRRASLALIALALALTPVGIRRLRGFDNLRILLVEHAPLLGKAITGYAELFPNDASSLAEVANERRDASRFDFRGSDILLITVDALRADHVGAYGYARSTTPAIDALAKDGIRFDYAYCATPHTSYSVTSIMTGKYMRPLLLANLGADSDTLAGLLRTYDYRTAAFYPPAVFFVDEARFASLEARKLDFEYAKVEFADPVLRLEQVREYLQTAPKDKPVFLWVHYFEPHEPYIPHPELGTGFGPNAIDAYDGEIRAVDNGIGALTKLVDAMRGPRRVTILSADHGEEFGEHGGHYHGTTVYEEQVRVPLIVKAPGIEPRVVSGPVQTIDIMPTILAGLSMPVPPRVRGRDLSAHLTGAGFAFAESEDQALLAEGSSRLVCNRVLGACRAYDLQRDPAQRSGGPPTDAQRQTLAGLERSHGMYEGKAGSELPEALRQALAGNHAAAGEVAELLDDVRVEIRRKAAETLVRLREPSAIPALTRAQTRDEDTLVRGFSTVALVRLAAQKPESAVPLLGDNAVAAVSPWAALALAEQGSRAGETQLLTFLAHTQEVTLAREILDALAHIKSSAAVPDLSARLKTDVRLRVDLARTLEAIGDPRARPALLEVFETERYVHARYPEAKAIAALGGAKELEAPLTRFAGMPEPFPEVYALARSMPWFPKAAPRQGQVRKGERIFVEAGEVRVAGQPVPLSTLAGGGAWTDVQTTGMLEITGKVAWVVPQHPEVPPPAPAKVEK